MAEETHGVGGLTFDTSKRALPPEVSVFLALVLIVAAFEILGRLLIGDSFLFNTRANATGLFNQARLEIIILQVSIVGIIAIGAIQAMKAANIDMKAVVVGGVDATQDALAAMKAGDLDATVFQDAAGQGAGALNAALKLAKGEAVDKKVYIPFQLVTPANMDNFIKKN